MARAFVFSEIDDPDLDWLVSSFLTKNPNYLPFECGNLPIVLFAVCTPKPELTYEAPKALPTPTTNKAVDKNSKSSVEKP